MEISHMEENERMFKLEDQGEEKAKLFLYQHLLLSMTAPLLMLSSQAHIQPIQPMRNTPEEEREVNTHFVANFRAFLDPLDGISPHHLLSCLHANTTCN